MLDLSVRLGHLDDSLRTNFWVAKLPVQEVTYRLKRNYPSNSVFQNTFEEI